MTTAIEMRPHPNPLPAYRERERAPGHWPLVTFALSAIALVIQFGWAETFQYDRVAVHVGDFWRLLTCQWTHWSFDHLLWDVIVFAALGAICERQNRRRFIASIAAATVSVPLAVHLFCCDVQTFRGLSGVDSALFGLLMPNFFLIAKRSASPQWRWLAIVGASAFVAKCAWEQATGHAVFAATDRTWRVVPLSHVVGFACGVAVGYRAETRSVPHLIGSLSRPSG